MPVYSLYAVYECVCVCVCLHIYIYACMYLYMHACITHSLTDRQIDKHTRTHTHTLSLSLALRDTITHGKYAHHGFTMRKLRIYRRHRLPSDYLDLSDAAHAALLFLFMYFLCGPSLFGIYADMINCLFGLIRVFFHGFHSYHDRGASGAGANIFLWPLPPRAGSTSSRKSSRHCPPVLTKLPHESC